MTDIVNKFTNMFPKSGFNGLLGSKPLETKHLIMTGVAIFVIAGLIYLIYNWFNSNVEAFHANRENIPVSENQQNQANKTATMMLFSVDWCPHCKQAKPEWDKIKEKYDGKTINGYKMSFSEHNCTKESPEIDELLDTYKIEGYPTLKLIKDNQVIEYDAKPTESTMDQFLHTVL
jgi:thiol-disulfide isomerase/thioredoxin